MPTDQSMTEHVIYVSEAGSDGFATVVEMRGEVKRAPLQNRGWGSSRLLVLFKDQVSERGFEIPVDDRDGSQIEGGMRKHQHPDSPSGGEERPEYETRDSRLLDTSQPLPEVMERRKRGGSYEHGDDPGGQAPSE